jgi:hypothetical protein
MRTKISPTGHELELAPKDLNAIQKFFYNSTPGFIKDGVGILNDNVKFARWKNIVKITKEAEEIRKRNNSQVVPLSLKASVEYVNAASLEEDPTVQTMWANLLASTTDMKATYISILKELSPLEAKILNKYYLVMEKKNVEKYPHIQIMRSTFFTDSQDKRKDIEIALENLIRQRLLKQPEKRKTTIPNALSIRTWGGASRVTYNGSISGSSGKQIDEETKKIFDYLEEDERNASNAAQLLELTPLGFSLLKACNEPTIK